MQLKTSMKEFEPYGSVYNDTLPVRGIPLVSRINTLTPRDSILQFFCFDCPIYLELQTGIASLVVSSTEDTSALMTFAVHRKVALKPGIYFALVAVSDLVVCKLLTSENYSMKSWSLTTPYFYNRVLPKIHVREISGYYYNVRNSGYTFQGEKNDCYELTFVDCGTLMTKIDGQAYELHEKDLIFYGPGQFHTQAIPTGQSCSYVTVMFSMENLKTRQLKEEDNLLLNRIFHYDKKIYQLIKSFVQESAGRIPYLNSLMTCLLQEIIIRLLQSAFLPQKDERPISGSRQHYQDRLLEKILSYIEETICEPITIAEICQHFSISRTSLQLLFKENLNQTPKKYISDFKLEKSCQLIRENKHTISKIALMLGFNSIHYFSRAFTQKYHIAPSEYSKQMLSQH
ncbi:MAG: AraC family transcriptional regulator [Lachnospiraceae bacterium]|nr:AraC family transcriptional regulator [Lachnospiraceae bacterium]MDY5742187.1 AraC family transcriptional regulator [Lachnospiraceae bacterium]